MIDTKICQQCGKEYRRHKRGGFAQFIRSRFCDKKCKGEWMRGDPISRFWSKIDRQGDNECWNWIAKSRFAFGYGAFADKQGKRRNIGAHQFSYKLHFGKIPKGSHVLHKCDNPPCVNPKHLFLGDQITNMRDMNAKGRDAHHGQVGSLNPNAKLSDTQVEEIRGLYPAFTQQKIAEMYGVHQAYVSTLLRGGMRTKPTPELDSIS